MDYAALAPTGRIRIAIAVGAIKSAVWTVIPEGRSAPEGITVDLATRIGALTGLPIDLIQMENSGRIVATEAKGLWDLTFVPVDNERRQLLEFGAAFHSGDSSYLVRSDSGFVAASDLSLPRQPKTRIGGVENTATIRSAMRAAPEAEVIGYPTVQGAVEAFTVGDLEAVALGRPGLVKLTETLAGTRVVEGNFHVAETAVAAPKGHLRQRDLASDLVRRMKQDGTVERALARHGMAGARIPPG